MLPEPGEGEGKEGTEENVREEKKEKKEEAKQGGENENATEREEEEGGEEKHEEAKEEKEEAKKYASVAFAKVPGKGGKEDVFHVLCLVSPNKATTWRRGKLVRIVFDSTPSIKGNVVVELYRGDLPTDEMGQIP